MSQQQVIFGVLVLVVFVGQATAKPQLSVALGDKLTLSTADVTAHVVEVGTDAVDHESEVIEVETDVGTFTLTADYFDLRTLEECIDGDNYYRYILRNDASGVVRLIEVLVTLDKECNRKVVVNDEFIPIIRWLRRRRRANEVGRTYKSNNIAVNAFGLRAYNRILEALTH